MLRWPTVGEGSRNTPPRTPSRSCGVRWGGGMEMSPTTLLSPPTGPDPGSGWGCGLGQGGGVMSGGHGWVCLCPGPLPTTAAGGNGRVQPFPRMRISFLPLSGDPEVNTQPWGARPAGRRGGGGGQRTPARHTALGAGPPRSSPRLAGTPRSHTGRTRAAACGDEMALGWGSGWRCVVGSFSPSP